MDLVQLTFANNLIKDIQAVSNMNNLQFIDLSGNNISDITPLNKLFKLDFLRISNNQITDIMPLGNLSKLETLLIKNNSIKDYSIIQNHFKNIKNNDFKFGKAIKFADPNLERVVRDACKIQEGDLYEDDVADITILQASSKKISDLEGIQYLKNLKILLITTLKHE